jgi:hypothetical protein
MTMWATKKHTEMNVGGCLKGPISFLETQSVKNSVENYKAAK